MRRTACSSTSPTSRVRRCAEADGFIAKPLGDRFEAVLDKIKNALERAGRASHADCLAAQGSEARPARGAEGAAKVRLVLDDTRKGRRTTFLVNGERCELQDARFGVLLKLVAAHLREPGRFCSRHELGILRSPEIPSRIRDAVAAHVPKDWSLVETIRNGGVRLNPATVVEDVAWSSFAGHPDPTILAAVKQHLGGGAKK